MKRSKINSCVNCCIKSQVNLWFTHQTTTNFILRFALETWLEIAICVVIGLGFRSAVTKEGDTMGSADRVTDAINYVVFIAMCVLPLIVVYFSVIKSKNLHNQAKKDN